ncbi:MAG: DnaJ domain-containing protein [Bacilli bacterium]|nr:DnaJ domain-containing protein [Bacilli bacterium]
MNLQKALKIMGLTPNFSEKELKEKYRELAKKYHPDHNIGNKEALKKMQEINEAHEYLKKEVEQNTYNQSQTKNKYTYDPVEELRFLRKIKKFRINQIFINENEIEKIVNTLNSLVHDICVLAPYVNSAPSEVWNAYYNAEKRIKEYYEKLVKIIKNKMIYNYNQTPFKTEPEIKEIYLKAQEKLKLEYNNDILKLYEETLSKLEIESNNIINEYVIKAQSIFNDIVKKYSLNANCQEQNILQIIETTKTEFEKILKTCSQRSIADQELITITKIFENKVQEINKQNSLMIEFLTIKKTIIKHAKTLQEEINDYKEKSSIQNLLSLILSELLDIEKNHKIEEFIKITRNIDLNNTTSFYQIFDIILEPLLKRLL